MKLEPKLEEIRWNIAKEKEMLEEWANRKVYKFELNSKKVFSIDTPPPYPRPF